MPIPTLKKDENIAKMYVFSAVYDKPKRNGYFCDFAVASFFYPLKSALKKRVKEVNPDASNIVILGITEMSNDQFSRYWNEL